MAGLRIGIIGGTGLGEAILAQTDGERIHVETPYGPPSDVPLVAQWEGVDLVFIARHGPGHLLNPSAVPYRANIWALKHLGVGAIIASGATGSLREDIEPGHLVLCDQVIDRTFRRASTFFDEGLVAHIEFADPFCPSLRALLAEVGRDGGSTIHHAGTYVCMEGPQFSTRAESNMHRLWGGDLIGMTCMPEAKLAREAEICYALIALPTDYDCWRPVDPSRGPDDLLPEIMANLHKATDNAVSLIRRALRKMSGFRPNCKCGQALKLAVWSDKQRIDPAVRKRLEPLLGRYLADKPE
jgi:5'-methylthioadenosine phosphorylase